MAQATTEFGAPVPTEEYEFFKQNFPQYGSVKWLITSMLAEFNAQVRANPSAKEQINVAIQHMLETSRLLAAATSGGEARGTAS